MIEIISEQEAKEQAVQPDYHEGLGENMHLGEDELKSTGPRQTPHHKCGFGGKSQLW